MKKIFTLIATALLTMGASAQTTVFSWEAGTATGGTVEAKGSNNAPDDTKITVNSKKADIDENNVTITLNEALAAGDKIAITGYRNKDTDANGTLYIDFSTGTAIDEGDEVKWNNMALGQEANTNEYTITDQAGSTVIRMARSKASTNVFITKFVITRAGGGGGGGETGLAEVWSASSLTFDPDTKILQEAVKSENKSASYVIPEDAKVFPEDTWKTADETGDISVVSDWLAAQSNPSLYATPLKEYTFTASTASVSMKAVSTPNTDSSEAEAWQNAGGETSNVALNTDACAIKWTNYVKPKTGNPSLGYYDFYDATSTGGTAHRVYDQLWKIGCGKVPEKGTYYEFTFAKAGSMIMGVFMNRPNQSAVVVIDKETLAPLAVDKLSFEGFCQNNKFKYPVDGEESTDPTYQKFNFREDYTIDVSAQSGRPLLGYLSFPVEAKTYFVFQPKSQVGIYGFQFTAGGDPSGVETIKTEKVWNANAPMYNLSGQKVDKSYKGIVIQNGRKFVNK